MATMTRAQFEARKAQVAPVQSAQKTPVKTMTRAQFEARRPVSTAGKIDAGFRKFSQSANNAPTFHFADSIKNPVGHFAASIPQQVLNIPSHAISAVLGGYGENTKDTLKRAARSAEVGLDIGSLIAGGGSAKAALTGGKQDLLKALLQGAKTGSIQGSGYGAGYGFTGAVKNDQAILPSVIKNAITDGVGGGIIGGTLGTAGSLTRGNQTGRTPSVVGDLQKAGKPSQVQTLKQKQLQQKGQTQKQTQQGNTQSELDSLGQARPQGFSSYSDGLTNIGPKVKRGFAQTVAESRFTGKDVKKLLNDSTYTPQSNDKLSKHAIDLVKTDVDKATDIALHGNDNLSVATASELIKHYQNTGNYDAAANVAKVAAERLTEAGRTIQAASLYNKLTPEGITRFAQKELMKEGLELQPEQAQLLHQLATEANNLTGEDKVIATTKMLQKVQEFIPSKFTDQLTTIWKAGLLTNPTTHIANVAGNTTMTALETAKDYPAVALDKMASMFTGKRTKALPNYVAMGKGAVQGAVKAGKFMKTGIDVDGTLGKIDYKQVNLPIGLKQYTQAIFRTLGATDKVFKETLLKKSLHELAVVDGINEGLSGKELSKFVAERYANPTNQMVEQATKDALYGTFNNQNALASALNKLKSNDSSLVRGATEVIAPFGRTPANIAARILDYSPAGFVKAGVQAAKGGGQRNVVESLSRALVGSGIIGAGYGLGKAGQMTGNYPTNPTEQALWEATGKQPGALNVGGNWQSLNRISPVGNLLSIGSGMADLGRIKPENVPGAMLGVAGKNLLGQTYLQGVSGAANAVQDPQRYGKTWTSRIAQSVIPSVIGATARATDPLQRQSNTLSESVQSRIPGLREGLLPKTDVFGRTLKQESNPLVNPFNTTKDRSDTTTNEIERLYNEYSGVSLDHPGDTASISGTGIKVNITPKELYIMEKQTGGASKAVLDRIIKSPQYQNMSDYDRAKAINSVVTGMRDAWKLQNISTLSNFKEKLQQGIQEQVKLRTPNKPFYTR